MNNEINLGQESKSLQVLSMEHRIPAAICRLWSRGSLGEEQLALGPSSPRRVASPYPGQAAYLRLRRGIGGAGTRILSLRRRPHGMLTCT